MRWSKIVRYLLVVSIILFITGCDTGNKRIVSEELRETAVEKLRSTLYGELKWEKVHAAEFLFNLGYTNDIYDIFLEEEKRKGDEILLPYRYLAGTCTGFLEAGRKTEMA